MIRLMTSFKLVLLCLFLWVQSAQAEHMVDISDGIEHVECLECKSLNQPLADAEEAPNIVLITRASNAVVRVKLEAPRPQLERSDPARAPPHTS